MNSRRPKPLLAGFLCVVALLGVAATAGCTNEGGSSGEKIVLGYGASPGWLPWKVAADQGLFEDHGLDVELKFFNNVADGNTAMADGDLDANNQTLNDTLKELSKGAQPQEIVTVNDTSTGANQIIARQGITSLHDLTGKKVAVEEGTVDHYWLGLALAEAGTSFDNVHLQLMRTDAATTAFRAGKVDAVVTHAPYVSEALKRNGSRAVSTTAEFPNACSDHLVVTEDMVQNRPADVQALVDTWFDTLDWINENQDEAWQIMSQQAGIDAKDYDEYVAGLSMYTRQENADAFVPGLTSKYLNFQVEDISDFLTENGLVKDRPKTETLLDDRFVKAELT